jgi:hypothetical protein
MRVREALIQTQQWATLIDHVLTHGDLKPGWLASVPDLPALAMSEPWGAQLAALEGLMPEALTALGHDPQRLREISQAYSALLEGVDGGGELHVLRLRELCRPKPRPPR